MIIGHNPQLPYMEECVITDQGAQGVLNKLIFPRDYLIFTTKREEREQLLQLGYKLVKWTPGMDFIGEMVRQAKHPDRDECTDFHAQDPGSPLSLR